MGRRRLWIMAGTALALVAILMALAILRPVAPFRFLDEADRVTYASPQDPKSLVYSWRVKDRQTLFRAAHTELVAQGFRPQPPGPKRAPGVYTRRISRPGGFESDYLRFIWDHRVAPDWHFVKEKGWLTVKVTFIEPHKISLWERIKAVFGL